MRNSHEDTTGLCAFQVSSYSLLSASVIRNICSLPFSMPDRVSYWWNLYNMVAAVLTIIIYIATYLKLYYFFSLTPIEYNLLDERHFHRYSNSEWILFPLDNSFEVQ
uniref:PhoLip_ATPase_C domain-containing protein n=1 Tax=Heterorhabditis bacteriophora TaxID=37862 RepID=A0A1I7WAM5_HETBA